MRFAAVARAVILDGGRVLLARHHANSNTFLPGGHIQVGEAMRTGLAREVKEELGLAVTVGNYLGAIETWWTDDIGYFGVAGRATHQLDHYFLTTAAGLSASTSPMSVEGHLTFYWAAVEDLRSHTLLPAPLQEFIPSYMAGNHVAWWWSVQGAG
jgi:8-oxo-dGTP pyrophosphatase MutT (NUDIX family)